MDRSFLSRTEVIEASRRFVCIRLATYEHEAEAELLQSIYTGRSGQLENTVFTILDPTGQQQLVRAGRSPKMTFRARGPGRRGGPEEDAGEAATLARMVESMAQISARYVGKSRDGARTGPPALPILHDLRLALNVASCDSMPLVIVSAKAEQELAKLAWSDALIGRFLYVLVEDDADLELLGAAGDDGAPAVLVVAPDPYGQSGKILARVTTDAALESLRHTLEQALASHDPAVKIPRRHIREGHRRGVEWKTVVPPTDPGRLNRRQREGREP